MGFGSKLPFSLYTGNPKISFVIAATILSFILLLESLYQYYFESSLYHIDLDIVEAGHVLPSIKKRNSPPILGKVLTSVFLLTGFKL